MASEDPRWLAEPAPGAVDVHIAVHEDAELTPELRGAIEGLAKALEEQEVEGYSDPKPPPKVCPSYVNCTPKGSCNPQVSYPGCALYSTCRIVTTP